MSPLRGISIWGMDKCLSCCNRTLLQLYRGGHSVPSQWHTVWLHQNVGSQLPCAAWVCSLALVLPLPAGTI